MVAWTAQELSSLDRAHEIRIAGRPSAGWLRTLVRVWHVVVGGALYVRFASNAEDLWYRGAPEIADGAIRWDGLVRDVSCTLDRDHAVQIDSAYGAKYGEELDVRDSSTPSQRDTARIEPR